MSYLVLARKYRPRVFGDVVGQEVATATLRGAIEEQRIGHAYLFCGPRGTGKTSTARIFAKALECEQGPRVDPCGTCERCRAADLGSDVDIVEIDAASNNGVEFVRDLREQAGYRPMRARFKVYIIDEVHMLSKPAFNALLKTLEEPPSHVKFLFATTELHKVPDTIVSRCQVLRLAPIGEETIARRLARVFELESVRAGAGVVEELARRARGGMRDALSLADQLLSLVGSEPELADLAQLAGDDGLEALERLLDALERKSSTDVLLALPANEGGESELVSALLDQLRALLLVAHCGSDLPQLQASSELRARMAARVQRLGAERLQVWLEELLHARERMRLLSVHARVILESTLLDLCRADGDLPYAELERRLAALERRLESPGRAVQVAGAERGAERAPDRGVDRAPERGPERGAASTTAGGAARGPTRPVAAARPHAPDEIVPRARAAGEGERGAQATRAGAADGQRAGATDGQRASALGVASEVWPRLLTVLGESSAALADVLRARGKLSELTRERALIRVQGASPDEHTLLAEPRARKACSAALAKLAGGPLEVQLVLDAPQVPQRAKLDAFTGQVTDMFGGRIEDEG